MTINIPLKAVAFAVYTLALLGGAFGISYGVFEWRDDDDEKDVATEITADEAEKSFSMTLETDEDFKEAARRIGALTPEFDCAGEPRPSLCRPIIYCNHDVRHRSDIRGRALRGRTSCCCPRC